MVEQKKILIVDDEPLQRELLGGFAQTLGYRVCEAASGEEALETIEKLPPAMVLLDVRLPGISGIETLAKMQPNDRVLIHAAAGGVGQAAVHLAKSCGADVLATASPAKWDFLKAQGIQHLRD